MEIKSQICTTREQSEKLLALGLKKETADMMLIWLYCYRDEDYYQPMPNDFSTSNDDIPAWSLHRLVCLYGADYTIKECYNNAEECYGMLISAIGIAIEEGYFNKDYLEERK